MIILGLVATATLLSQDQGKDLGELVNEHAVEVESIDPDYELNDDLDFLQEELEGVEIIMLGEQSHGDGSTFLAKTRLIKYLHEEMGFSVLVFESGLVDMYRTWSAISNGADSLGVFNYGVFPVWANTEQMQDLFTYILDQSKTDNPLFLAGFDINLQFCLPGFHEKIYLLD